MPEYCTPSPPPPSPVRDNDEAITWFTDKLDFTLIADEYQPEQDKRWVLVAPLEQPENAAISSSPALDLPTNLTSVICAPP